MKEITPELRAVLKGKGVKCHNFTMVGDTWRPGIMTWDEYEARLREDFEIRLARHKKDEHEYIEAVYGTTD